MNKTKIKVLIIDPWCLTYTREMTNEMSKLVDLTLVTKYSAEGISNKVTLNNLFFKVSDAMNRAFSRKIIRWLEYVLAWIKILKFVRKVRFDVIHIQWLLSYPTDIFFLKKIKKYAAKHSIKLVYTAHNALPHVKGEKTIKSLKIIYRFFDTVIVHGNDTKSEIQKYFPNVNLKFYIQKHGAIVTTKKNIEVAKDLIKDDHYKKIAESKGVKLLLLGNIFYNKGFDRIVEYWYENQKQLQGNLLMVAGQVSEANEKHRAFENKIKKISNVLYYPEYVSNAKHDFLFYSCDIVCLPYRRASMSGVIFSAAQFCKTVLTTNVGCISDYIIDGENAFLVANNDDSIKKALDEIIFNTTKEKLVEMGESLNAHISSTCAWSDICQNLIKEVYC